MSSTTRGRSRPTAGTRAGPDHRGVDVLHDRMRRLREHRRKGEQQDELELLHVREGIALAQALEQGLRPTLSYRLRARTLGSVRFPGARAARAFPAPSALFPARQRGKDEGGDGTSQAAEGGDERGRISGRGKDRAAVPVIPAVVLAAEDVGGARRDDAVPGRGCGRVGLAVPSLGRVLPACGIAGGAAAVAAVAGAVGRSRTRGRSGRTVAEQACRRRSAIAEQSRRGGGVHEGTGRAGAPPEASWAPGTITLPLASAAGRRRFIVPRRTPFSRTVPTLMRCSAMPGMRTRTVLPM